MKETCHGKAKYQNLVLRKFLKLNTSLPTASNENSRQTEASQDETNLTLNESAVIESQVIAADEPELVLIKRDNQPSKTIQALMSDRSTARKHQQLFDYRISGKYFYLRIFFSCGKCILLGWQRQMHTR